MIPSEMRFHGKIGSIAHLLGESIHVDDALKPHQNSLRDWWSMLSLFVHNQIMDSSDIANDERNKWETCRRENLCPLHETVCNQLQLRLPRSCWLNVVVSKFDKEKLGIWLKIMRTTYKACLSLASKLFIGYWIRNPSKAPDKELIRLVLSRRKHNERVFINFVTGFTFPYESFPSKDREIVKKRWHIDDFSEKDFERLTPESKKLIQGLWGKLDEQWERSKFLEVIIGERIYTL